MGHRVAPLCAIILMYSVHSLQLLVMVHASMCEVQDGSDWVIDGGKCWISNSLEAGVFVVFANADPSKGHRGREKKEVHNGWAVAYETAGI